MKKSEQTKRIFVYRITESVPFFYFQVIYTYSIRVSNDSYFFEITTLFSCKQGNPKFKIFWPKLSKPGKTLAGQDWVRKISANSHKKIVSPSATPNSACRTDAVF